VSPLRVQAAEGAEATPFQFNTQAGAGVLDVFYKGRRLLCYAFATNQFKPYVRELYTLKGDNVLLDAPADHLHHHGLMYAIRVNGVNFWEERDRPGFEKSAGWERTETGTSAGGRPEASFTQLIYWVGNQDALAADSASVALLVERRTLRLSVDEAAGEIALDWRGDFEPGRAQGSVTLTGANYNGLGLRLPESFNRVARHQNSEGSHYLTEGKGDVTRARWSAVSGRSGGHEIMVALFGRRMTDGLPSFFTMTQPFTYLSVTQGLDRTPVQHAARDKFSIAYRLVIYSEVKTPAFLDGQYLNWSGRTPDL
jgi:hypothetical protein